MTAQKESESNIAQNHSDFSIEHILNRAGSCSSNVSNDSLANLGLTLDPYSWLQCSRYCPPKVPRAQKRCGSQKRQLGRHPRIPFSCHQLSILENKFQQSPYLSSEEVITLAKQLQLADVRVKIWFQNRRARERREKLQNEQRYTENEREKNTTATTTNDLSLASSVPQIYNFFPVQATVENTLPSTEQVHFTSKDVR